MTKISGTKVSTAPETGTAGATPQYRVVVFAMLSVAYYYWTWSPFLAEFGGDNAIYYFTANMLSPWQESFSISSYYAQHSQYPPLYPLLLALFGGGNSILAAHLVTTTFLLISFFVFYCWLLEEQLESYLALMVLGVFALAPGTYIQALSIHSENLYLLLSLLALYLARNESAGNKQLLFAAVFVACCTLTRSAGVAMMVAFVVWLFLNSVKQRYTLSLVAVLPGILWNLFNDQKSDSYATMVVNHLSENSFAEVIRQFMQQAMFMLDIWQTNFTLGKAGSMVLAAFALIALAGMCGRVYRRKLDGIYGFLYMGMIVFWPYPAEASRLLYPLVPVMLMWLFCLPDLFKINVDSLAKLKQGRVLLAVVFLLLVIPNVALTVTRFLTPLEEGLSPFRRTYAWQAENLLVAKDRIVRYRALTLALEQVANVIPEDKCVYSIKPSITGVFTGRISKIPPKPQLDEQAFKEELVSGDCEFFLFYAFSSPTFPHAYYPWGRVQDDIKIVQAYHFKNGADNDAIAVLAKLRLEK